MLKRARPSSPLVLGWLIGCLCLVGCASLPPNSKRDPRDPWERLNRTTFKVNTTVDHAVIRPVARGYQKITPRPIRDSLSNFFDNLFYPVTLANDLLQLKFKPFGQDIGRLVLNTTVGIGGLFDPATRVGLPKNDEDLGQTFGHYGAGPGPYLVIPILGPSDIRDGIGRIGDGFMSPLSYVHNNWIRYPVYAVSLLDARYRLLPQDKLLDEAYDPYTFMKNAYLQRRQYQVSDGKLSEKQQEEQDQKQYDEEKQILEESGPDQPDGQAPKGQQPPPPPPPGDTAPPR